MLSVLIVLGLPQKLVTLPSLVYTGKVAIDVLLGVDDLMGGKLNDDLGSTHSSSW